MILKAFKEKSNQKFVNGILSRRKIESTTTKVKSVGVIFNDEEFIDFDAFSEFLKHINIQLPNQKFFTFSKEKTQSHSQWDDIFTSKDFGWKGKLYNNNLRDFTDTHFDVLICYFLADNLELKQIAAMSNAAFKVGLSNKDERLYDLMIAVKPTEFEDFKTELEKYLTLLNKI